MNLLNNFSFAIIAFIGGIFAIREVGLRSVSLLHLREYARQFTRPLNELANEFNTMLSALAGAERVYAILDEKVETDGEQGTVILKEVRGEVVYQNVSFSYEDQEERSTISTSMFALGKP